MLLYQGEQFPVITYRANTTVIIANAQCPLGHYTIFVRVQRPSHKTLVRAMYTWRWYVQPGVSGDLVQTMCTEQRYISHESHHTLFPLLYTYVHKQWKYSYVVITHI